MTNQERYASVWDAVENTKAEAENMKLRSALMLAVGQHIKSAGLTRSEAAKLLGVTRPRISDLLRGKISVFGIESLVNMAAAAGMRIEVQIREAD